MFFVSFTSGISVVYVCGALPSWNTTTLHIPEPKTPVGFDS